MSTLSAEQIAAAAYKAGFRGDALTTATAIAFAESSGNPHAHNAVPPDNSYGLWQINMLGALGPDRRHEFHLSSNDQLFDPATNARAAFAISSHGHDFGPWSTYTNGAYRNFLDKARKAAHEVTRNHGKPTHHGDPKHPGSKHPKDPKHKPPTDGYVVDPSVLNTYAGATHGIAHTMSEVNGKQLHKVREIADDSFGKVGKETGFAKALDDFGGALQAQVKGVGTDAKAIADEVAYQSKAYQHQENQTKNQLLDILNGKGTTPPRTNGGHDRKHPAPRHPAANHPPATPAPKHPAKADSTTEDPALVLAQQLRKQRPGQPVSQGGGED